MNRVAKYLDIAFCCLFLPIMIIIFPIERWATHFPVYSMLAGLWIYFVYVLNRWVLIPSLSRGKRGRILGIMAIVLSIFVNYMIASYQPYVPKPSVYDWDVVRRLPITEQYQQCIWSLFVIVEFFSLAMGILCRYTEQRQQWLMNLLEEHQVSEALQNENTQIREALASAEQKLLDVQDLPTEVPEYIMMKSGHKSIPIRIADILLVEAMENYVKIYRDGLPTVVSQSTMKLMEEALPTGQFMRVHRSYIVARAKVERYTSRELNIVGHDSPVPVGRKYTADFQNAMK